uniref:TSA: Wollemia nobilis Ref_Wollemi_Transcript_13712_1252 transcribed RNA sequence n=1 Tax=Wollemia nobilis TaxID=56998 RepID=A0A0C9RKI8_9CONI
MEGSVKLSIVLCLFLLGLQAEAQTQSRNPLASAFYVFGDSTIDAGNNNRLQTVAKANFLPYGRDFENHRPTGRFTNGKLSTDLLAELAGVSDLLPAYLDPDFKGLKLLTGATFGSGASGYDDSTSRPLNVMTLGKQLENFRSYRAQIVNLIGRGNVTKLISEALFVISTGSNDFINNYYNPLNPKKYSVAQYQDLLIGLLRGFVQSLYSEGARRVVIIGLPPFGCLPSQITLHNLINNTCDDNLNDVASSFNKKTMVLTQNISVPSLRILYFDIYQKLYDMSKYPSKYGFEEGRRGCCGTGFLEASILCNKASPTCADSSKYVFWDSFHPTTKAYGFIADDLFQQARRELG